MCQKKFIELVFLLYLFHPRLSTLNDTYTLSMYLYLSTNIVCLFGISAQITFMLQYYVFEGCT